ncbi:flagellar hook capping FlgD N-terminal domain-containing protein [Paucibacter sediminis]|uniref:Basal-body rod modification protein FlgD n=1 Tax=Paucibacter sediminis TaxID=3019553 RepID=A0AA95NGD0_9BURK|nr:flagellar hook capping FlgD N-terminal domain-containing protein [Paucibacter sp. S2-9]WIT10336.1 flagellar hook capping FlgD N-terminal domain-containing protein [Paucibacter sp. S2-9]
MAVSTVTPTTTSGTTTTTKTGATKDAAQTAADTQDRFLKLLVAQMKNQDPMNPMDNGQVTTQMAQIQTVSGISTLNSNLQAMSSSLGSQFSQMQVLQGAGLVGRDVSVAGNRIAMNAETGKGEGSFEIASPADRVKLEVLNASGAVVDTVELGAQTSGLHGFSWDPKQLDTSGKLSFRISASSGSAALSSTTYASDRVVAVNNNSGKLQLQLQNLGPVDYTSLKTID